MVVEVGVDECTYTAKDKHYNIHTTSSVDHWYLYTKFHGNPSNASQDIWLQNSNVKLLMVTEEKSEVRQSY